MASNRPNSPDQTTSVWSSKLAAFQVLQQGRDRLIDGAGVVFVALLKVAVLVPAVVAKVRTGQLQKRGAHTTRRRAIRHCVPKTFVGAYMESRPYSLPVDLTLALDVHQLRHRRLHAVGGLVVGDGRLDLVALADAFFQVLVELAQRVDLRRCSASLASQQRAVGDRRIGGLEDRALVPQREGSRC